MIIPWRVDVPQDRLPIVNWLIVVLIVAVFLVQMSVVEQIKQAVDEPQDWELQAERSEDLPEPKPTSQQSANDKIGEEEPSIDELEGEQLVSKQGQTKKPTFPKGGIYDFFLNGWGLKGLFGHMWLHGGILHLLGNLLFLWVFGNAVCAKIGTRFYLPLYVVFGLIAAAAHLIFVGGPMIGASGAIWGVIGMYLVFFPQNDITCYWIWIFLMFFGRAGYGFTVSSYWIILLWVLFNIYGAIQGGGYVAYFAHLGGFAAGVGAAVLMLKTKIVTMERYEKSLLQILEKPSESQAKTFDARLAPFQREITQMDIVERSRTTKQNAEIAERPPQEVQQQSNLSVEDFLQSQPEQFIRFMCPCGKAVKMPSKYAGKKGRCPKCGESLRIPDKN